jgi:hypothetical protein
MLMDFAVEHTYMQRLQSLVLMIFLIFMILVIFHSKENILLTSIYNIYKKVSMSLLSKYVTNQKEQKQPFKKYLNTS